MSSNAGSGAEANAPVCPSAVTVRATGNGTGAEVVDIDCMATPLSVKSDNSGRSYLDASVFKIQVVESLPNAAVINLSQNKIVRILDSDNEAVNELDLSSNGLQTLTSISIPRGVYRIVLDGNRISTLTKDTFSSRVTDVSIKNNRISSLEDFTFSDDIEKLDLSLNEITELTNFVMPPQLTSFTCENCAIKTFGGVIFSSNLRKINLKQNAIESFEIANSSLSVLEKLEEFQVSTKVLSCEDPNAKLVTSRAGRLCVLSDAAFNAKYKVSVGTSGSHGSTHEATTKSSGSSSSSKLLIIGLAGGGVVFLILVCVTLCVVRRRKRQRDEQLKLDKLDLDACLEPSSTGPTQYIQGGNTSITSSSSITAGSTRNTSTKKVVKTPAQVHDFLPNDVRTDESLQPFHLLPTEIVRGRMIARGGYGAVYLASLREDTVVVKQMLPDKVRNKHFIRSFMDEIRICAQLEHPKIVKFIGITWTTLADLSVVMEYMPNGDLSTLLMEQQQRERKYPGPQGARAGFDWFHSNTKLKCKSLIALDIAEALVYLHSFESPIIHRDLKPKNVLMSSAWEAKLTDFGISREMDQDNTMTAEIGTVAWIAPEVLKGERYSEKADVYSFGVILSELDTCRRPYASEAGEGGHSNTRIAVLVSAGQLKPSLRRDCPECVRKLIKRCLAFRPQDRPSAVQIHYELRHLELKDEEIQQSELAMLDARVGFGPGTGKKRSGSGGRAMKLLG